MTDRELLEQAARAAGWKIDFLSYDHDGLANVYAPDGKQHAWNPLTNDGDALRLAIDLDIDIYGDDKYRGADAGDGHSATEPVSEDTYAANRRAIVRAAAELGRSLR
jgi:hypothetical protein